MLGFGWTDAESKKFGISSAQNTRGSGMSRSLCRFLIFDGEFVIIIRTLDCAVWKYFQWILEDYPQVEITKTNTGRMQVKNFTRWSKRPDISCTF